MKTKKLLTLGLLLASYNLSAGPEEAWLDFQSVQKRIYDPAILRTDLEGGANPEAPVITASKLDKYVTWAHVAAELPEKSAALFDMYLEFGGNPNAQTEHTKETPLMRAAFCGNTAFVKRLLSTEGINIRQKLNLPLHLWWHDRTAANIARQTGHMEIYSIITDFDKTREVKD